jgi:ubiquinone biosynthesis protein
VTDEPDTAVDQDGRRSRRARHRQVAEVLARHGLGFLLGALGLERMVPFQRGLLGHLRREQPYTRPEHLRLALQELGPAFVKLGQILSTRADLLPPEYQAELAHLQDQVPAEPWERIRTVLHEELGRPPEDLFAELAHESLAAASIGQAHLARLPTGDAVVVKVRRPGVVERVEEDLEVIQELAQAATRRWQRARDYDLVGLARELGEVLRSELDYVQEGRSAERIAASFADWPELHVPRVHWNLTTSRVLTLDLVSGLRVTDREGLDAAGVDRAGLARVAARALMKMIFEDGFFHADPHPGNFFVEPGGRIGLIDFGMVGSVDGRTRRCLAEQLAALTTEDAERLVDAFVAIGAVHGRVDRAALGADLVKLARASSGRPLAEVPVGRMIEEALGIARRHRLHLPTNLALLFKTIVMAEGMGAALDDGFRLADVMAPYARRLALERYTPRVWTELIGESGRDLARLLARSPRQLQHVLDDMERGGFEIGVRGADMERVLSRLEVLANRVVLGMLASAFIVGLAALMAVYHPPGWQAWAGFAFGLGFVLATALGAYLAWSILRPARRQDR